ncbi:type II secretion system protein GspL [Sphingomonas sp.]|uniref:type II secretion system protein GspL n=1 Tax=Sphingomonas sp. TaxID=28214 RepID=UPI001EBB305C|nr:type II secretion system protein GspL [Sphingomonas sp.]MBX3593286.1 general secretion pathway protein GspL [Sphingomonas sp.]
MTGPAISGATEGPADGVWALSGGRLIIAEPGGPATVLVPGESVLLLAVDLPLASHARRLAALPFAIEDRIADPIESVHVALGAQVGPKRYLAAVVSHARMREWVELAQAAGLDHAAMVPDPLALPVPDAGEWCAESAGGRVLVRSGDGAGFAVGAGLIGPVWESAGRPRVWTHGAAPVGALPQSPWPGAGDGLATRLLNPAIDLRQGAYARRSIRRSGWLRRLGWIAAAGAAAHIVIAAADTVMLRAIAERRAADLRATVAAAAPGANLSGDLDSAVMDLLPPPGSGAPGAFLPLLTRASQALAPLGAAGTARSMRFDGGALILDLAPTAPDLAGQVRTALRQAGLTGDVAAAPDGGVTVTVRP